MGSTISAFSTQLSKWAQPGRFEISLRITSVHGFESLPTAKPATVGLALSMAAHLMEIFYIYGGSKGTSEKIKCDFIFSDVPLKLGCHSPALLIDEMSDAWYNKNNN